MSTVAPLIGWPFFIDIKKTSLLPSVFFFVKFPVSVQCQQTALTFDLHFTWKLRHCNDRVVVLRKRIITGGAHSFCDPHIKLTLRFHPYLKSVLPILCFFRGHNREFDSLGLLENIVRHISGTLPL